MIDSHCHLHDDVYASDVQAVLARARLAGVTAFICPGTSLTDTRAAIALAGSEPDCFAAVGVHPTELPEYGPIDEVVAELTALAEQPNVVAIGEVGFDLFRTPEAKLQTTFERQQRFLIQMIGLAEATNKPLVLHLRSHPQFDVYQPVIPLLKGHRVKAVSHCYSGNTEVAHCYRQAGITLSFAGNITYRKPIEAQAVLEAAGHDFLLETDAPYLAPVPFRGQQNEPTYLTAVRDCVAVLLNQPAIAVDRHTTEATKRIFQLPEK